MNKNPPLYLNLSNFEFYDHHHPICEKLKSCLKIKNWFPPPYYFFENLKVFRGKFWSSEHIFATPPKTSSDFERKTKIRPFAPPRMIAKIYIINLSECDCCHILKKIDV